MKRQLVVVFDLDGTLADTRADITAACNYALRKLGLAELGEDTITSFVGDGARNLCQRASGLDEDSPKVDEVLRLFKGYYLEHPFDLGRFMPGAKNAVLALQKMDCALALCTNKPRDVTVRLLGLAGATDWFVSIVAGGDTSQPKPSPEPLNLIASNVNCSANELVMVGDGPQDVLAGKAAGSRTVAVWSGYAKKAVLEACNPDVMLPTLASLPGVIKQWLQSAQ